MFINRKLAIPVILIVMAITLTACSDAFVDALNPAIDVFNEAAENFNDQMDLLTADNEIFSDPDWVASTETSLSVLRGAGLALRNLPEPDSSDYNRLNSLVQQLADATVSFVDTYRTALASGNISLTDDADPYMDKINELLPQINAEISRLDN